MQEKELKILLSKSEFDSLCKRFKCGEIYTHINFYYSDNQGVLKEQEITVRVREKHGNANLEVKIPSGKQGLVHVKEEYQKKLGAIPLEIKENELTEMTGCKLPDVAMKGYLITERRVYNWDSNTEICLDHSQYLGHDDYEIEVEYVKELPDEILEILKDEMIEMIPTSGKCKRFFEKLEENGVSHD